MRIRYLSSYIEGVALKKLSGVEAKPERSHQHEFNGANKLKDIFGSRRHTFDAKFVYLSDDESETVSADGRVTWYDAREHHPKRSEYRLYFSDTPASEQYRENDLLAIIKKRNKTVLVIVARHASTAENQIMWLFGPAENSKDKFTVKDIFAGHDSQVNYVARLVLQELGVEAECYDYDYLDEMKKRFKGCFPTTRVFSAFARETAGSLSSMDSPDDALVAWMEREELLFRTFERDIVQEVLEKGFKDNVDAFIDFSLSVQNRRKARAGYALENHLEQIFMDHGVRYSRDAITENRARPDFIFPGIVEYKNPTFPGSSLFMLGSKTTCKDRWRQVLSEASRIRKKHLITLEPGISEDQTSEMQEHKLQLVLPAPLHDTFSDKQRGWLMNVKQFVKLVKGKQQMT